MMLGRNSTNTLSLRVGDIVTFRAAGSCAIAVIYVGHYHDGTAVTSTGPSQFTASSPGQTTIDVLYRPCPSEMRYGEVCNSVVLAQVTMRVR